MYLPIPHRMVLSLAAAIASTAVTLAAPLTLSILNRKQARLR